MAKARSILLLKPLLRAGVRHFETDPHIRRDKVPGFLLRDDHRKTDANRIEHALA
ncbi:MAG TPA: hypothetical protein VLK83_04460 [Rhodanobacteraceae bacterium]|nr:hypothetical protein [Rhodanobacteraceae bacterium]